MEDERRLFRREVTIGGIEPILVVLAAGDREAKPLDRRSGDRQCPGTSCRRALAADAEPVPIGAIGQQAFDLDMDRMREFWTCQRLAAGDQRREARIGRDLPRDLDRLHRHAAMLGQRIGGEPRPDDEAVRDRIARRDAQAKRVGAEQLLCVQDRRCADHRCGGTDQGAAIEKQARASVGHGCPVSREVGYAECRVGFRRAAVLSERRDLVSGRGEIGGERRVALHR